VDVLRDAVEVRGRVALVAGRDGAHLAADAHDRLVGQFLGHGAAAAEEDFDEGAADLLVARPGALAVRVEPPEQVLEILALPISLLFHLFGADGPAIADAGRGSDACAA
jgi:hypothetical protein